MSDDNSKQVINSADTTIVDQRGSSRGLPTPRIKRRMKDQIKEAIDRDFHSSDRSITDTGGSSKEIIVPKKGLRQPGVHKDPNTGSRDQVFPGNRKFKTGDEFPFPPGGGGGGSGEGEPSRDGEGEDDFGFNIDEEEYQNILFEDMELPDMVMKQISDSEDVQIKRKGTTGSGSPSKIEKKPTIKNGLARYGAMIAAADEEIEEIQFYIDKFEAKNDKTPEEEEHLKRLYIELAEAKDYRDNIPLVEEKDKRFRNFEAVPIPNTKAVMFCMMDVSGSMGEKEKDLAKRFFTLLYKFIFRHYEKLDVVFISHTTSAREVTEEEFFYGRETGGTIVKSAMDLMLEIQKERYPVNEWNLYAAQASDGDVFDDDGDECVDILHNTILPMMQYYAYIQVRDQSSFLGEDLFKVYEKLDNDWGKKFQRKRVLDRGDVYPVLRELFQKENSA